MREKFTGSEEKPQDLGPVALKTSLEFFASLIDMTRCYCLWPTDCVWNPLYLELVGFAFW